MQLRKMTTGLGIVCLAFAMLLSACTTQDKPAKSGSGGGPSGAPSEIHVAVVGPMTGDYAQYGKYIRDSVQLAVDEINSSGALDGVKLVLDVEDDKLDPKEAVTVAQKLVLDDRVVAIVGHFGSGTSMAALPVYKEQNMPMVSPSNTSPDLSGIAPNYFRTIMSDDLLARQLAQYAVNHMGAKRIATLYAATDGTITQAQTFNEEARALGAEIVINEQHQTGDKEFMATLDKVKNANPDLIFMSTWYTEAALISRQAREAQIETPFLATDGVYAPGLIELGQAAVEGFRFGATFHPGLDNPRARDFVQAFKDRYGYEPEAYGANSYDAMHLIGEALKHGGQTREAVRRYLEKIGTEVPAYEGATGSNAFDANHDVVKAVVIVEVKDGEFVPSPVQP